MKTSQNDRIRKHLIDGHNITPMDALNLYGCFRLASRIKDLRIDGMCIKTENETRNGKTYASYSLDHQYTLGI